MGSPRKPSRKRNAPPRGLRVLLTCIGRRVELLKAFRRAAKALTPPLSSFELHGTDVNRLSPAVHKSIKAHLVPPLDSGHYIDALVELVDRHRIDLLVPLIDFELIPIAAAVERFAEVGCCALVSSEAVVQVCRDKLATYRALKSAGIDTPATWTWAQAVKRKRHRFPYFLKPQFGSAARGNYVVNDEAELRAFGRRVEGPIVQEFVDGVEHTLDVYTGLDGKTRCVVPRRRLEVRSGEVSKGLIVKDPKIMAVGKKVAQMFDECRGVITVQCIVTPDKRIRVIEINPRFGGGVPLAIHAGADFPKWIMMERLGLRPDIDPKGFCDDVAMLRYDESVFVKDASKKLNL